MELREYYEQSAKSLDEGNTVPSEPYPRAFDAASKEKNPKQRLKQLQKLQQHMEIDRKQLTDLMDKASVKDAEQADSPARLQALAELLAEFPQKIASVIKFKLHTPLLDKDGRTVREVAMKRLDDENPAHAQAQYRILEDQCKLVQKYYPDVEIRLINDKDNKPIAVVLGVDAEEFNAIVQAEKTLAKLKQREANIAAEMLATREAIEKENAQKAIPAKKVEQIAAPRTDSSKAFH